MHACGMDRNVWYDNYKMVSEYLGPLVKIVNSEKKLGIIFGSRIMSPTRRVFFRSYTG